METGEPLRVAVFGAGAIGTYLGGSLALRGHVTVFVERPEVAAEIERRGVRIERESGESLAVPEGAFRVASSAEAALASGPLDLVVSALKSFDTQALIDSLLAAGFGAASCPILSVSNGVDNEPALAAAFGPGRVIAGTVMTAVGRRSAGDVVVERMRGVGVAAGHALSEPLARAMGDAGLNARLYASAAAMKWSKLLTNLLANASSAILDMAPAEIFSDPGLCRLEVRALREALAVMRASEIGVVDLPRTPVRLLALAARLPPALSRPLLARAVGGGRGGKMPSFHIDLHSGRGASEVEFLNGAVVRHGERKGVATPVNHLLTGTLLALTKREIPIEAFARDPSRLLAAARG